MLIVLLVRSGGSIVIVVWLSSSLLSSSPCHLINVVVVAVATSPALKVDCYVFTALVLIVLLGCSDGSCHHIINVKILLRMHFLVVWG